jgi:hypothetical protein
MIENFLAFALPLPSLALLAPSRFNCSGFDPILTVKEPA